MANELGLCHSLLSQREMQGRTPRNATERAQERATPLWAFTQTAISAMIDPLSQRYFGLAACPVKRAPRHVQYVKVTFSLHENDDGR